MNAVDDDAVAERAGSRSGGPFRLAEVVANAGGPLFDILIASDDAVRVSRVVPSGGSPVHGDLVLAVGMSPTPPRLAELLELVGAAGATGLVVRGLPEQVIRQVVHDSGSRVAVLALRPGVRWDQAASTLAAELGDRPAAPTRLPDRPRVPDHGAVVLGLRGPEDWCAGSVEAACLGKRVAAAHPGTEIGFDGQDVIAVLPVAASSARAIALGGELIAYAREQLGITVVAAVDAGPSPTDRSCDRLTRVLDMLERSPRDTAAAVSELHGELVLDTLRRLSGTYPELTAGALEILRATDRSRGSSYLETLTAYFDAAGDLNQAAAALYVHPNTVRYRMRRARDLAGIDLTRPLNRLILELQLRLASGGPDSSAESHRNGLA